MAVAAISKVKPSLTDSVIGTFCAEVNVLGTANVLEAAKASKVQKLVYAGELCGCRLHWIDKAQHLQLCWLPWLGQADRLYTGAACLQTCRSA